MRGARNGDEVEFYRRGSEKIKKRKNNAAVDTSIKKKERPNAADAEGLLKRIVAEAPPPADSSGPNSLRCIRP
jgi:bifunctional DNA-binding transcriptional regulator/antitoxin component of YhaV-PrlF toxin-antitoxin module